MRASDIALHRRFVLLLSWVRVCRGVVSGKREVLLRSFVSQLGLAVPPGRYSFEEVPPGGEGKSVQG